MTESIISAMFIDSEDPRYRKLAGQQGYREYRALTLITHTPFPVGPLCLIQ